MKFIAPALLVAYAVYSTTLQINIAHSLVLFSLAALFAWNQFLLSKSTPKLEDEISKLKSELEQKIEQHKETYEVKLTNVEGELQKIAVSQLKSVSSSTPSKPEPRKFVF